MNEQTDISSIDDEAWYDDDEYMLQRMNWLHAAKKHTWFIEYTKAQEANDDGELARLEMQNPYLSHLYDELGPCDDTEYHAYCRLVQCQLDFLKENQTYKKYCAACREGQPDTKQSIERDYPRIAELFSDFGDLYGGDISRDEWVTRYHHLFFPVPVQIIEPGNVAPSGVFAATLPNGIFRRTLLDKLFWLSRDIANAVPKYQIEKVRGETYAKTYQRVNLAWMVTDQVDFAELTVESVTKQYFYDAVVYEGMGVQPKESTHPALSPDDIKNKRREIERLRKFYAACVIQSIEGIFPALDY